MASHGPLTTSGSQGTAPARGAGAQPAEPCARKALLPLGFLLISKKMVDDGGLFLLPSM